MWRLDMAALREAAAKLARRAEESGGTLIAIGSPRTPDRAYDVIRKAAASHPCVIVLAESPVRYAVLLNDADEQFVTADSVSMISEAVITRKPVGLIHIKPDAQGRYRLGPDPDKTPFRDPRRFWVDVQASGLVGTVDAPAHSEVDDPVETAVAAVRRKLADLFQ